MKDDLRAATRASPHREVGVDQGGALVHAADAAAALAAAVDPAPVVGDAQREAVGAPLECELGVRRGGVAHDVRQRLLGDAVDHELLLARERREVAVEVRVDLEARLRAQPRAELRQRARQAELVEGLRAQPLRDAAQVVEVRSHCLRRGADLVVELGPRLLAHARELQERGRQVLTDLVVQLLGDAQALGLLRADDAPHALLALGLEAVEHRVERLGELRRLGRGATDRDARARPEQVDLAHHAHQLLEGRDEPARDDQVREDHHDERGREDRELAQGDGLAQGAGGEDQHGHDRGACEHHGVCREDPPEEAAVAWTQAASRSRRHVLRVGPDCIAVSMRPSAAIRCSIGGCVERIVRREPFTLAGTMKKAFISAAARRSRSGAPCMARWIFISADDSALGRPVRTAAPRSATNSRWRESASISTKESRYTATLTSSTTMNAGWPPSRSRPPPRNGANCSTSAAMLAKKLATVMISTSRCWTWASSCATTPSSSRGSSRRSRPVVTHTVDARRERPIANALGISVSAIAIRGFGRSACTHRRSTTACSPGASDGDTMCAPIARSASLSERNSCASASPPTTTSMTTAPVPAHTSTATSVT